MLIINLSSHLVAIFCNSYCKRSEPYGNGALNAYCMYVCRLSDSENQKGVNDVLCSIENQKGTIAIDLVQWKPPSGSNRNMDKQC